MISAEKVMNIKVVELIKIYNFYFDHFSIRGRLNKFKFKYLIFAIQRLFVGTVLYPAAPTDQIYRGEK